MSGKPCLNCGESHTHDGIYCSSCRGSDTDQSSDGLETDGGEGTMEMWDQAGDSNEEYREIEIPEAVYSQVSEVVENDGTYRDEVDFLLSAIRLELREASAP